MQPKIPLGYIELDNGEKAVYAMNDFFLNYIFETDKEIKNTMSVAEKYRNEGLMEGIEIGEVKGVAIGEARGISIGETKGMQQTISKALELINKGVNPAEALLSIQRDYKSQD